MVNNKDDVESCGVLFIRCVRIMALIQHLRFSRHAVSAVQEGSRCDGTAEQLVARKALGETAADGTYGHNEQVNVESSSDITYYNIYER